MPTRDAVPFYPLIGFLIILAWAFSLGFGVAWNAYEYTANIELASHYFFTILLVCCVCTGIIAYTVLTNNRDPTVLETVYLISAVIGTFVAFIWVGVTAQKIPGVNNPKIMYTWGGIGNGIAIFIGLLIITLVVTLTVTKVRCGRLSA